MTPTVREINKAIKEGKRVFEQHVYDREGSPTRIEITKARTRYGYLQVLTTRGNWRTVVPPTRVVRIEGENK